MNKDTRQCDVQEEHFNFKIEEVEIKEEAEFPEENIYKEDLLCGNFNQEWQRHQIRDEVIYVSVKEEPQNLVDCENKTRGELENIENPSLKWDNDEKIIAMEIDPLDLKKNSIIGEETEIMMPSTSGLNQNVTDKGGVPMAQNIFRTAVLSIISAEDTLPAINWMKQHGLIASTMKCSGCEHLLHWTQRASKCKDKFVWKCQNQKCKRYKNYTTIRKGSFFSNSKISLPDWIHIMYLWSIGEGIDKTNTQTGISKQSLVHCYNFFRKICEDHFKRNPIKLGGIGKTVEVDELCFSHKVKHHKGRGPQEQIWVVGIIDTSTTPAMGYMQIVEKRDAATLLPIIESIVLPGSTVHTGEWKAYWSLQCMPYNHKTVNHSVNFVDKQTGVHMQTIESYWNKHKYLIKKMKGCRRDMLETYLFQMMWQDRYFENGFFKLCEHICDIYKF